MRANKETPGPVPGAGPRAGAGAGPGRRIAVLGAGVAGLTAAYVLELAGEQVTLIERDDRLGGHAHTHALPVPGGPPVAVDSGFIVHNERTYPLLTRLFRELGVVTRQSEMSMSVHCEGCGLQYAGARGARGVFAQPANALNGRFLRMLAEVGLFHRRARALLEETPDSALTLAEFASRARFSRYFVAHFLTPLVASVWSCAPEAAGRYPAAYLFRFLHHHGLLSVTGSPTWRTVAGGSRSYVSRIAERVTAARTGVAARSVRRHADGVEVVGEDGRTEDFDAVVIATHPDQALALLADASPVEREVLGAFRYSRNPTQLHTDTRLLPAASGARASWNYLMPSCNARADRVLVSYDMNRLQRLDAAEHFVVTLNGAARVDAGRVLAETVYEHPLYTPESVAAQARLPELSGPRIAYAGAWHGWGFHEDGCRSGVQAAAALGVRW